MSLNLSISPQNTLRPGSGLMPSLSSVPRTGQTTLLLILGDSNTAFSRMPIPASDPNVKTWQASTSSIVVAQDPLEYISWNALTGPATFLGKKYRTCWDMMLSLFLQVKQARCAFLLRQDYP